MTPSFALDLSLDGIRLLFRAEGGWTVVGDVALEDPALAQRLAALRSEAEGLAGAAMTTELVIPPSQIRYATIPRPAAAVVTAADLEPVVAGLTPLDPAEFVFDWEVEGEVIRLALVDRQTLLEAETFAEAHGFRPLCFSARPTPAQFPRPPAFGTAVRAVAASLPLAAPAAPATGAEAEAEALPDTVGAEALARSLSAPLPGGRRVPRPASSAAWRLRPALALGAGGLAAAALALAVGLGTSSDPAASLPEIAPDVALTLSPLGRPDTSDAPPAPPPAADAAPLAPGTLVVAVPDMGTEPSADTSAPAALVEAPPAVSATAGPARPAPPSPATTETIYLASIDPVTRASDAIALPAVATLAARARPMAPPSPPGTSSEAAGEARTAAVTAVEAPASDAAAVTLGSPPLASPTASAPEAETAAEPTELAQALPDRRPLPRPSGLAERNQRATLGGRTRDELAALRPLARPASEQTVVAEAPSPPSDYAVATSRVPRDRPADLATRVATANAIAAALAAPPPAPPAPAPPPVVAQPQPAPAPQVAAAAPPPAAAAVPEDDYDDGETEVVAAAPNIPTSASVARQATIQNAISLRQINLIGVYGTDRDRRALVRLSNGRYVKVRVGDRLDGGQIAAIGRDELRYVKGGRNFTLQLPSG